MVSPTEDKKRLESLKRMETSLRSIKESRKREEKKEEERRAKGMKKRRIECRRTRKKVEREGGAREGEEQRYLLPQRGKEVRRQGKEGRKK